MKEQFVTYDIALKLIELGFNEECLGFYHGRTFNEERFKRYLYENTISAPLWQQAIDWFRKSWKIHIEISNHENGWGSYLSIEKFGDRFAKGYYAKIPYFIINTIEVGCSFRSYDIAREQAILKAIELCKNN